MIHVSSRECLERGSLRTKSLRSLLLPAKRRESLGVPPNSRLTLSSDPNRPNAVFSSERPSTQLARGVSRTLFSFRPSQEAMLSEAWDFSILDFGSSRPVTGKLVGRIVTC